MKVKVEKVSPWDLILEDYCKADTLLLGEMIHSSLFSKYKDPEIIDVEAVKVEENSWMGSLESNQKPSESKSDTLPIELDPRK